MSTVSDRLDRLTAMPVDELRQEWRRLYRAPAPRLSRSMLILAIAYRIQDQASGGMGIRVMRRLDASGSMEGGIERPSSRRGLPPGTRLVRDWNGRTYVLTVTEDGIAYDGETFRSLSQVARRITGAHWSGPRFFGLHDHG